MSTDRNSIPRLSATSLSVTMDERSPIPTSERVKAVQAGTDILNKDLLISSPDLLSPENTEQEAVERVEAANAHREEARTPESSTLRDATKNKLEAVKMEIYQEKLLKENKPSYYSSRVTYQANKRRLRQEIIKVRRERRWSSTFPCDADFMQGISNAAEIQLSSRKYNARLKTTTKHVSFRLPNIFEENTGKMVNRCNRSGMNGVLINDYLLSLKVKEFIQNTQPEASVTSLRVQRHPVAHMDEEGHDLDHSTSNNTILPRKIIGVPINTNTCPLMSHFKDRKWYYQDKSGKCRYLRVPESPIPPISYVFSDDTDTKL